jgi:hypothetical protein
LLTDSTTQGYWLHTYGATGSIIPLDASHLPAYTSVNFSSSTKTWNWAPSGTKDPRALLVYGSRTKRIASTFYNSPGFSIDINFTDGYPHRLAMYFADFDKSGRAETIAVRDAGTGTLLDTRSLVSFSNGEYLVWQVKGHVIVQVTSQNAANAIVNGLFFDSVKPARTFRSLGPTLGRR